jgi:hypothetical protein
MWDEKERKWYVNRGLFRACLSNANSFRSYIVDSEDYDILSNPVDPEEKWTDAQWAYWGLAEESRAE